LPGLTVAAGLAVLSWSLITVVQARDHAPDHPSSRARSWSRKSGRGG